jgi:hypothetical protein
MTMLAEAAGEAAVAEAAAQQVELDPFDVDNVADEIAVRADAQATVMARSIAQAAAQKAISEAGSGLAMDEVATRVDEYLNGLSNSYLEDQLGGTLMQAQNGARRSVFDGAPGTLYSSELLDSSTCLAPEVLVTTARGLVRADEVTFDDQLLTHSGAFRQPSVIMESEVEGQLIRIDTASGRSLRLTADHQVLVVRDGTVAWEVAGQLQPGDGVIDQASVEDSGELGSLDFGLRNAPDSKSATLNVLGLSPINIGSKRVPVGAVSFDDEPTDAEVSDPRADLSLSNEVEGVGLKKLTNPSLDAGLGTGGLIAAVGAETPSLCLEGRDDAELGRAVLAGHEDGWSAANFRAVVPGVITPPVAERGTAATADDLDGTSIHGAGTAAVGVARSIRGRNAELDSALRAELGDLVFGSPGVGRTIRNAALVAAVNVAPTVRPSDLRAARLTKRKRLKIRTAPASKSSASTASTVSRGDFAANTRHVHKDTLVEMVTSISREQYDGVVYDFTIPGDQTFFADGLLVHNCTNCKAVDGTEYDSMAEAIKDYPSGGFHECLGGLRCRGTLVFVAESETPPSVQ